ncbi:MAG: DUF349 domain-containing protein [Lysobacteraceae bacterium]|nr:MAG: DUF349 domain-containing protein [Xanthomonadaceae bacterium]
MKLPFSLGKPRWQSKDAAVRRAAVVADDDGDLLANLGRIARDDADPGVRIAAMKRLADPGIAQGLARDDLDAGVRAQALALWLDLLTGRHAGAPTLVERTRLLRAQDEAPTIEHVARHAREPELRAAALERATRPAFLLERALEEADASLRTALVGRIDNEGMLQRLAERTRKSDKTVNRLARERVEALRIARGDAAMLELRARQLCERLEQLVRDPASADERDVLAQWTPIAEAAPSQLRARFEAARSLLVASREAPRAMRASDAPALVATASGSPEVERASEAQPAPAARDRETDTQAQAEAEADDVVAPLLAQARFAASVDEARAAQRQQREQQQALLHEFGEALRACDAALERGASAEAHAAHARVAALRTRIDGALPKALAELLHGVEARHAELSRWQFWADNERRRQICEEIEAVAAAALHPDAVAAKVRDAQAEWTRLDAVEGPRGRGGELTRRFHAACRAALAPAQAYFHKRKELRQTQAGAIDDLLARVAARVADETEPDVSGLRREAVQALRELDRVEPRARKALAQRLKDALDALDARQRRRDDGVEQAKAALIAEAETLADQLPRGAVAATRELQQRWQACGNGRRSRDQAQWKAFRAALDRVYERLDGERTQRQAQDADSKARAEALCVELESLAAGGTPAERGVVARIVEGWNDLRSRDDSLARRFAAAREHLHEVERNEQRRQRHQRFDRWREREVLCVAAERGAESPEALRAHWDAAADGGIALPVQSARFEAALAGTPLAAADPEALHGPLLELELLAGIEALPEDRERRRELQVARLASRMRGVAAPSPADELVDLLERRSVLGAGTDEAIEARFETALAAALASLP